MLDGITEQLRNQLKSELLRRAMKYFPRIFAKWGVVLSEEQKDNVLEVLFLYESTEEKTIYRTGAIRKYNIPPAYFKTLNSRKFPGMGPEVYFNLSDIFDVMLVKYGSLEEMELKKQQKNDKKTVKIEKKKREAQLKEEEKERKYDEQNARRFKIYNDAKQILVAKYGPYVLNYMDRFYNPYKNQNKFEYITTSNADQLVQIFMKDMLNYIRASFNDIINKKNNLIMLILDTYLTRNFEQILSGKITKRTEFNDFYGKIFFQMKKINESFKKSGFVVGTIQFFEKFKLQLIESSYEDMYAIVVYEYDAMYTELIRSRNYSELQQMLRPEKYVEVYEQVHGKEDSYMFLQMELTKIE
jgi:hypothetical protein